jgi:Zn-dependent protease with chaperone function
VTFLGLTATLTLVAYATAMLLGTPLALILDRAASRRIDSGARSRRLFAARIAPTALGLLFALGFVFPSFVLLEPSNADERVGPVLGLLAAASGALVVAGAVRVAIALLATRRVVRGWAHHARPLRLDEIDLPAFAVDESFPLVAIAGWLRPKLYVSRAVLESCTAAELQAIVAHECGHLREGDPWRLLIVRACPDLLALLPAGAGMASRWGEAAEEAADDHASVSQARSLDLASALIRVARLAGSSTRSELPLTALYRGGGVAARVARILERPAALVRPGARFGRAARIGIAAACLTATAAVSLAALRPVHAVLEALVFHLG